MHTYTDKSQEEHNNGSKARLSEVVLPLQAIQITDILEGMSDALYAVDDQWRIIYINRKAEEIWGCHREDVLGHNVWTVFPYAVGTQPYHAYLAAMRERRAVTFEYYSPVVQYWLDVRAYPSGVGLVVHFSDITAHKAAEAAEKAQRQLAEALRDSLAALTGFFTVEHVMRQILDSASIVVPSEAGCIILFEGNSGRVAYFRGFTPEAEAFFKDYQFSTRLASGEPVLSDKQAYFVPDTQADPTWITLPVTEWIRSSIGMPIEIRGEVIGLLVVDSATPHHFKSADMEKLYVFAGYASLALENAQHVTQLEEKVAARTVELNDAKERVEAILNNSPDAILLVHPNLHIQQTNEAFHQLFAYEPDDTYFGSLYDLIHINDLERVRVVIETAVREPASQQVEMRCYRKNGTLFEAELSISYIAAATNTARFVCILRDITARKRAQNALAEERNLLRTLIDTIPAGIYIKDVDHRYLLSNTTGARSVRTTPAEIVGKDDFALFPPQMAKQFYADEEQIFQSGLPLINHEERSNRPDGNLIWVSTTKVPLRNLDGELIGLVGITRDISERRQRERQLRYYASLQENVSDAVIATDLEFRIQSWNRAAETIYGWRAEEMIGRKITACLPTLRYVAEQESDEHAAQTLRQQGDWQGEIVQRRKDGTELYIQSSVTVLKDEQGLSFGVVGINHDITERKRAEEALREQRDFLQLVIDSVPDLILVKDYASRFQLVNANAAQIYGLKPVDMVGKTDAEINPYPDEVAFFRQKDLEVQKSEQTVFIPEQTILGRYYQTTKIPLKNTAGQPERLLVVSFDITTHKQAETALQHALEKEKELGELKSRFFSMASHEFRNPLTSVLLMTEMLRDYWHELTDEQIEQRLSRIQTQVSHLNEIMEDVLQLSRLEVNHTEYSPAWFDLDTFCRNILDEFQHQSDGVPRVVYAADGISGEVYLDKKLIRHLITNLISNALKYSLEDKRVQIRINQSADAVTIQVQDEGIGIPAADLKHLFEPFHRANNVGKISGTGLGLTIAKQAVELHGGTIAVESQVGIGTLFIVRIPSVPRENDPVN